MTALVQKKGALMAIAVKEPTLETGQTIEELELNVIGPAPDNPRKKLDGLDELAASMEELGMLQPLVVTPRLGKFMVVCGHRRYAAAKKAKLKTAPAIIRDLDEPQRIKAMLIENCQRTDLSPLEEARAYQQLVDLGLTQKTIAVDVGKTQGHISKRLTLLDLPEKVQAKVDSGGISLADATELAKLKDHPKRLEHVAGQLGRGYADASYYVRLELREVELEASIATALAAAEKKGLTVVDSARDGAYWFTPPKGTFKLGSSYDELPLDAKQHAKEPCHAVGIERKTGELVPLCTDRKRHPKVKTWGERNSGGHRESADEKHRREQRQQLDEAKENRLAYVRRLLAKKVPLARGDALRLFVATLIDGLDGYDYGERACSWLGVLPEVDLSETTVARAGALHVVTDESENKDGATIITAPCGFRGLGKGIQRPDERDKEPDPAELCDKCRGHLFDGSYADYEDKLRELLADANESTLARIGVAVALAWHEASSWRGPEPGYLRMLEATGYALSTAEQSHIAEEEAAA